MERHQRIQLETTSRSTNQPFKVSPFKTPGFRVQQQAAFTPASKAELWENYQRASQMAKQSAGQTRSPIQAKLSIGQPGDKYEQEADSVADRVMVMSEPAQVQREELGEEEEELQAKSLDNSIQRETLPEEEEEIQTKQSPSSNAPVSTSSLEHRLSSSKGGGSPLSDEVRSFMEPRFGADFSSVRVHTDSDAVQMNRDVSAQAFAHGQDVYFGAGKAPAKDSLTAHELTHVVQQTGNLRAKLIARQHSSQFADNFHTIQRNTSTPRARTSSPRPVNWNRLIMKLNSVNQIERQKALQRIREKGRWEEMLNSLKNRHVAIVQSWLDKDVVDGQAASLKKRIGDAHNSSRAQLALASIETAAKRDTKKRITPRLRELLALGVALPRLEAAKHDPDASVTQEGVLTIAQVNQAVKALLRMHQREYLRLSLLLELSGDSARLTQSFLLLEATAARAESLTSPNPKDLGDLEQFSNSIRGMDQQTAIDQTSATSTSAAQSKGLTQKFTDSCGPTAAQLIRAEADPVEALRMNKHNELGKDALSSSTALEQETVLERDGHQTALARGQSKIISKVTAALLGSHYSPTQRQAVSDYINGKPFSHPDLKIGITKLEIIMGSSFPGGTALIIVREGSSGKQRGLRPNELVYEANNQMDVDAKTGRRWEDLFDNELRGLFVAAKKQVNAANMAAWSGRVTALLNKAAPLLEKGHDLTFVVYWNGSGGHFMTFNDVRTFSDQRMFLVHNPSTGRTTWMLQSKILSGGPWPSGGQGLICGLQG